MPKGYYARNGNAPTRSVANGNGNGHGPITTIEVTPRSGTRGRLDKLVKEYTINAQALAIAARLLDEDELRSAQRNGPQKLLAAINHRNSTREIPEKRQYKKKAPHRSTSQMPIHGKALSLFFLEHMEDSEYRPYQFFVDELTKAGSPPPNWRVLNAALAGGLARFGYSKKGPDGGYRKMAKGRDYATALRTMLEAKGLVTPGGYLPA